MTQPGRTIPSLRLICTALAAAFTLAACGGGGGDPGTVTPPVPPPTSTTGEPDVTTLGDAFTTYWNLCAKPRTGIDPYTGKPYPDRQGTLRDELTFLRAWSHQYYLWYNEIPGDIKMADFTDPIAYFEKLKTPVLTPAGTPKDKYHFTYKTEEWDKLSKSGIELGYGITWSSAGPTAPRNWQVATVEAGSPADLAGLRRGDLLVRIDDIDFVNATDKALVERINAALFPENPGESHTFVVRRGGIDQPVITMQAKDVQALSVKNTKTFPTATGKTGYISFENHNAVAERQLIDAFTTLRDQGVNDLVLDLRYNGGGLLHIAAELGYMIAGPVSTGKVFERLQYNDKIKADPGDTILFPSTAVGFAAGAGTVARGTALPTLNLRRVTILTTSGTCSASESVINALRGIDVEVNIIGAQTCGKPYGFTPVPNCGTTYFSIEFGGVNAKGIGDFSNGFAPTCAVPDDLTREQGDPQEALLATALSYQQTGVCPPSNRSSAAAMGALRTQVRPQVSQIAIHTKAR